MPTPACDLPSLPRLTCSQGPMPNQRSSRSRSSGSRRSRSRSSGSRRRRTSTTVSRHEPFWHMKFKESNYGAAICSICAIMLLCTAMSEPRWVAMKGGGCSLQYLGVKQFFYSGRFVDTVSESIKSAYQYGPDPGEVMNNCVTYQTVLVFKTIIALCFFVIIFNLGAFLLDLIGSNNRAMKIVRRNAFLSVVAALVSILIDFMCYWVTRKVKFLQDLTKLSSESDVDVTFDLGFYLVTAAAAMSVFATAFNCLWPVKTTRRASVSDVSTLLDDYDGAGSSSSLHGPVITPDMDFPPPPPPYTPSETSVLQETNSS